MLKNSNHNFMKSLLDINLRISIIYYVWMSLSVSLTCYKFILIYSDVLVSSYKLVWSYIWLYVITSLHLYHVYDIFVLMYLFVSMVFYQHNVSTSMSYQSILIDYNLIIILKEIDDLTFFVLFYKIRINILYVT